MGMILVPAFFILAILVIAIGALLKKGSGGSAFAALCLAVVGGVIFCYFVLPFYSGGH
ncbi:hypothetical protein [Leminorella grimontii]|uniref:hypothetical protein n=1 Tax=Leminorella grimontii TaxID=82981 RepID=UPI0020893FB6|nr:hypothetical protein [Leminorella grimontii]GKX61159.1 hypothetical protein SOASR031_34740 [Leminorella grimontii]